MLTLHIKFVISVLEFGVRVATATMVLHERLVLILRRILNVVVGDLLVHGTINTIEAQALDLFNLPSDFP